MTQYMIGTMTGLSNETISRMMSPMVKKERISISRGLIIIEQPGKLKEFLGS